jgi:HD-GYP domain-containing protein (c-di-GMP phosphodiesterase class II)
MNKVMYPQSSLMAHLPDRQNLIFHPAPLATLRPESGAHFELYLALPGRSVPRYLLYKASGIDFSEKKRVELLENGVKTLYVKDEDAADYYHYVDRTVGKVLASDKVPPQEKSRILYDTSQALVKSTFERPESPLLMSTNQRMVAHTVESITAQPEMLRTMVSLFSMDYSLYTHSVHVSVLGTAMLLEVGSYTPEDMRDIAMGYLLHDIGKSRIEPDILNKPGMLSPWEIKQIERHPDFGVGLMQSQALIRPRALEIIHDHHEKLNGNGYPRHLNSSSISIETRICSVADIFDAFTSHRVYRPALSGYEALRQILAKMSNELDDEILHLLIHRLGPNARRAV